MLVVNIVVKVWFLIMCKEKKQQRKYKNKYTNANHFRQCFNFRERNSH